MKTSILMVGLVLALCNTSNAVSLKRDDARAVVNRIAASYDQQVLEAAQQIRALYTNRDNLLPPSSVQDGLNAAKNTAVDTIVREAPLLNNQDRLDLFADAYYKGAADGVINGLLAADNADILKIVGTPMPGEVKAPIKASTKAKGSAAPIIGTTRGGDSYAPPPVNIWKALAIILLVLDGLALLGYWGYKKLDKWTSSAQPEHQDTRTPQAHETLKSGPAPPKTEPPPSPPTGTVEQPT